MAKFNGKSSNIEDNRNKVTQWSGTLSNENYPSEKLVKEYIDNKPIPPAPTIDNEMSDTSENPVQNKVIKAYVDTNAYVRKKIKYNIADLNTILFPEISAYQGGYSFTRTTSIDGKRVTFSILFVQVSGTRTGTECADEPILTEHIPLDVFVDTNNANRLTAQLKENTTLDNYVFVLLGADIDDLISQQHLYDLAVEYGATSHQISNVIVPVTEHGETESGKYAIGIEYNMRFWFTTSEEATAFNSEIGTQLSSYNNSMCIEYEDYSTVQGEVIANE